MFSTVSDKEPPQDELNKDLQKVNNSTFQLKVHFNPDPTEQAEEVYFSIKLEMMPFRF